MDKITHIKSFSNIAEKVWMARNGIFHGKDNKENLAIKKANLVPVIEKAFATQPTSLRERDRILLTNNSKIAMLQTSYQNQLARLGSIGSATSAAAFTGRQPLTTETTEENDETGYLPMEDGRVINPIDRGPAL
jgi:rhamnose utilization protein RhaD (predicted bifunctional aldolase and dehydrogenase)